ncbi:hypothetical protein N7470_005014 [Penicillium chermesinum]|nr:hypothetical protein N7470_005014 [Penicillium chermesinum]
MAYTFGTAPCAHGTSSAALTWNIINSTCFTKHLQQCRQELEEAPEYETDRLLVELVKIQHLTEKIFRFNHREELVDTMPGFTSPSEEDALLYTSSLEAEMEGMRRSLPASLEHNYLLSSHYSITHIRLYENLLANSHPWEERMTQSLSPASDSTQSEHNIHYAAATQAVQEWLHTWLSIPVCYYFYMPQPGISHLIFAATMLVRRARLVLLAWGQPAQRSATGSAAGTAPSDRPVPKAVPATVGYTPFQGFLIEPLITLAGRFESAKQEIGVAHATEWKNDFFDIAGMILRNRADRIEKWCGVVNAKGFLPRKHTASDSLESPNAFRTVDDMLFEQGNAPLFNDADLENWLWAGDFFDGMGLNPGPMDGFGGSDPVAGISMGIAVDPSVVYR